MVITTIACTQTILSGSLQASSDPYQPNICGTFDLPMETTEIYCHSDFPVTNDAESTNPQQNSLNRVLHQWLQWLACI